MSVKPEASDHQLNEKCAVFGVFDTSGEASHITYYGLWALQHRGQESSGIASANGGSLYGHSANGLVANVYRNEDLETLPGNISIGHNRYGTSGGSKSIHNQPFVNHTQGFAFAHNGNLPDTSKLENFLKKRGVSIKNLNDSNMMSAAIAWYKDEGDSLEQAITNAYPLFEGVFSSVAMDSKRLIAFRDKCGIRPLSIGTLGDGYVVASETCAFDTVGAKFLRDVEPGEMVVIDKRGITSHQLASAKHKLDIFEFVYFARPDSVLLGQRVNHVRENFGREMAKEFPIEADVVIPVPDSAIPAALGYANASGIPFDMGLIKNRYINRTFIQPTKELRKRDVKMKLNPVLESLSGKRVILVDDSIVRGTTMRQIVEMIKNSGALELHILVSSPPIKYPDFYGINTPDQTELVAATMTNEQIKDYLSVDSLNFLSQNGMVRATGLPSTRFSMSCFDGVYPIPIGDKAKTILHRLKYKPPKHIKEQMALIQEKELKKAAPKINALA